MICVVWYIGTPVLPFVTAAFLLNMAHTQTLAHSPQPLCASGAKKKSGLARAIYLHTF